MSARDELLSQLAKYAYNFDPVNGFKLASGRTSDEYLDCKRALSRAATMAVLGNVFLERLHPAAKAIGGLTMGSDPISMSTCQASAGARDVDWFTVRKEPKGHGRGKQVEGYVTASESVAVVDDVVTSGASTIKAIEHCRDFGLNIVQVIVLVDREEAGGMDAIRDAAGPSVEVSAIFTKSEVKKRWQTQQDVQSQSLRATA